MARVFVRGFCVVALVAASACASSERPALRSSAAISAEPRVLRVGQSGDYPPFSELRDGRFHGFSVELAERYAAARTRRLEVVRFEWASLMGDLAAGRFELADSGITVRPERSVAARYTVPIARTGSVLLLRRPAWARNTGDVNANLRALDRPEFRLAVNRGGHLERVARAHFPNAQVTAIPGNAGVRTALAEGRADAALTNTIEAPRWAEGLHDIETVGPFTRDWVSVIVRADHGELAQDLDAFLLAQEQSGALDALRARHFGFSGPDHATATPLRALLAATAERLSLMPAVGEAKRQAGLPIDDAVQEGAVLAAAFADVQRDAAALGRSAPSQRAVHAFFTAQFEAAKQLQRVARVATAPSYSLTDQLRPALARISQRMTFLLVRLPGGLDRAHVERWVRDDLSEIVITNAQRDALIESLVAISADLAAR